MRGQTVPGAQGAQRLQVPRPPGGFGTGSASSAQVCPVLIDCCNVSRDAKLKGIEEIGKA